MRDIDRGDVEPALQFAQFDPHLGAQFGVEVAERLVEQHDGRRERDGAGQCDALLLAARQHCEAGRLGEFAHLHQPQGALDILGDLGARQFAHPQAIGDIVEHGHMRPYRIGLEHHRDAALLGRNVAALGRGIHRSAVDPDRPGGRLFEPGNRAQGRGLAAARGAQQGHVLAAPDGEADPVDRRHAAIAHDRGRRPRCAASLTAIPRRTAAPRGTGSPARTNTHADALDHRQCGRQFGRGAEPGAGDRRRDDLRIGPDQKDRDAELAHAGDEQQQPGRDDAGPQQRHRHGAQLVAPGGAADPGAFLEALVDLQHDAGQGAHPQRHQHREIGQRQQPQCAVDRDRDVEPGPQQRRGRRPGAAPPAETSRRIRRAPCPGARER